MPRFRRSVVWLRRDLRLDDNAALARACQESESVVLAFIVDPGLLANGRIGAPITQFFFGALQVVRDAAREHGSDVAILQGEPASELPRFVHDLRADALFYNEDYEPQARERDARVTEALERDGFAVHASLDHVYFGAHEVRQRSGEPYRVFTPYKRVWLDQHHLAPRKPFRSEAAAAQRLLPAQEIGRTRDVPAPEEFGFTSSARYPGGGSAEAQLLLRRFLANKASTYAEHRDEPALDGTARLSPHLRAGTIGIRAVVNAAFEAAAATGGRARASIDTWIGELIWRDFYQAILAQFPQVDGAPFQDAAASIRWENDDALFAVWCDGRTGYPIVDAAMRQLNTTGWMHNRLRMIVASFLTKDLLIDWRRGERYFEQHLADADLAANNGGWQWAASTGTDAVPYFRIFNPVTQSKRFDPDGAFIRRMVPELRDVPAPAIHEPYGSPIVDHAQARIRALHAYERALKRR